MADLALDTRLPASLPAGRATALFLMGWGSEGAVDARILVDGVAHRVTAARMPRPDLGMRSGWWVTVPVPAPAGPEVVIEAAVDGRRTVLGRIPVSQTPLPGGAATGSRIAVCLATYEPDEALLRAQVGSLQAQTDQDWTCVVSDDGSSPAALERIERVIGGDPRFELVRSSERRFFYRNFERALELVPPDAGFVALCDQDDRWHPDKLATLRAALAGGAVLAFSDQRLTDRDGRVLSPTMWQGRDVNADDLASMLVANSLTGAAALFRRELLDVLLPFPETPGMQFHDHWLALAALATGELAYVDRPLYDYVQHRQAVFGDATTRRPTRRRLHPRAAYFFGYVPREVAAQTLLARAAGRMRPDKRTALARFVAAQRSAGALAWLLTAPRRATTLGSERELAPGVLWRWAAGTRLVRDSRLPDAALFEQRRIWRWRVGLVSP